MLSPQFYWYWRSSLQIIVEDHSSKTLNSLLIARMLNPLSDIHLWARAEDARNQNQCSQMFTLIAQISFFIHWYHSFASRFFTSSNIWDFVLLVSGCVFLVACLLCCHIVFWVAWEYCFFYFSLDKIFNRFLSWKNRLTLLIPGNVLCSHEKMFSSLALLQCVSMHFPDRHEFLDR